MTDRAATAAEGGPGRLRALDHLVLPVPDLTAAAETYAALGFTVGRRNRHPWGTENHIVQFPTAFLELIALAPDFTRLIPSDPAFPFAGFLAGQAASVRPSGMIVLQSADAAADATLFQDQGIGSGRTLDFARTGQAPDGTPRTVAFSLAFAEIPGLTDLGFFVCRQHHPEHFWDPAQQRHANGATGVRAVVIEVDRPADHAAVLQRFAGASAAPSEAAAVTITLADGALLVARPSPGAARLAEIIFDGDRAFQQTVDTVRLRCGT